jgi:glycosyltransferase involved in cell wall biosynthesis
VKLFIYSYFAVIRERLWGGAQFTVSEIISRLARRGVEMVLLCPPPAKEDRLLTSPNLTVVPTLHEPEILGRPLFPHEHAHNIRECHKGAQWADVVWTHDRTFPLRVPKPVVLSLDNLSYFEEMESLTRLMWDVVIFCSKYLCDISTAIAGPAWWDGHPPEFRVIPFGIDLDHFQRTRSKGWGRRNGLSPTVPYILFPHRPDPEKGFTAAFKVMRKLAQDGLPHKLLIPVSEGNDADNRYYAQLRSRVARLGIKSQVVFHKWVEFSELPAYYSFGSWCLSPAKVPEGFGFTPIQAIGCGTPVIATRAGAMGDLFPDNHGVEYVDFDDVKTMAAVIKRGARSAEIEAGQRYVRERYDICRVVEQFLEVFCNARKCAAQYRPPRFDECRYQVPPWCRFVAPDTVWHDYYRRYYHLDEPQSSLLRKLSDGHAVANGDAEVCASLVKRGFLYAVPFSRIPDRNTTAEKEC